MTASPKTYLIACCTRGIGRGLVAALLLNDNSIVIAGIRDPAAATAKSLEDLPKGTGSKLIVVKIDADEYQRLRPTAITHLCTTHSITTLLTVIANAHRLPFPLMSGVSLSSTRLMLDTNTLGPMRLFQAVFPLLHEGARSLVMSSLAGSVDAALRFPFMMGAYGMSKAVVNWWVAKASFENPTPSITALHPGMVDTDMAAPAIKETGIEAISVDNSVAWMLKLLDLPKKDVTGKFLDWEWGRGGAAVDFKRCWCVWWPFD